MKATANRIGNSSKESICIDGKIYIKSTACGVWNWVGLVEYYGGTNSQFKSFVKSQTKAGLVKTIEGNQSGGNTTGYKIAEVERV